MSKRALGKGIDALLVGGFEEPTAKGAGEGVTLVSIDQIDTGSGQPRKSFSEESLDGLADSIRQQGILQPILVEPEGERYSIVAGERRFRAAKIAGLAQIPAIVRTLSREEKLEIALIENIQREDLTPIEEAEAYRNLMNVMKLSQEELARRIGKKRSTIANSVRLLNLPLDIQEAVSGGGLSAGHARALLATENPADQRILFRRILERGLSVREAEAMSEGLNRGARSSVAQKKKSGTPTNPEVAEIERRFMDFLGTKVVIHGNLIKGKIEISYFSKDDLSRLYQLLDPHEA